MNTPVRRKLTTRSINKLVSGYKFESIMDDADGQAILIAQTCGQTSPVKTEESDSEKVFLKIGLEKDTMNSIRKEDRILKDIEHPHIIKPVDYKKGKVHEKKYRRMVLPYFKNGDLWTLT